VEREKVIKRNADELADAVGVLLSNAREIIFIDPHFDPYKPKARKTLKSFLMNYPAASYGVSGA